MIDLIKYSMPVLINANKNKTYRERVRKNGKTLMGFLKNNNLITIDPFYENGEIKENLEVRQSELTDEGLELFKKAIPSWWNYLDKGGDSDNISILEKALTKVRSRT